MRRALLALLVAVVALVLPAAPIGEAAAPPRVVDAQTTPLIARVARPFGAALRAGPSPYQEQLASLACGEVRPVLARTDDGWVELQIGDDGRDRGWVSERLVQLAGMGSEPQVDCTGARFLPVGSDVQVSAPAGCASLRARPASFAVERVCVDDGHELEIVSGPFDDGRGEAWFEVDSPSTGSGWMLADYVFAV